MAIHKTNRDDENSDGRSNSMEKDEPGAFGAAHRAKRTGEKWTLAIEFGEVFVVSEVGVEEESNIGRSLLAMLTSRVSSWTDGGLKLHTLPRSI